ncbi:hypothetical protein FFWV33_10905 [Flavobacterium faecale]|uniref:SGNH hydrolase-type esterase domain-containing protein n=1 Tax=Flavobacterium faecale TaxID=1355330 RepID=A0A2S1LE39_9FLAO|nr:GDSL-type esterase/lipase family protein [Flavobacterium faecale]AWG21987.1 hypothetical protein FFWV33_10905 [Flavobacterium faecale]
MIYINKKIRIAVTIFSLVSCTIYAQEQFDTNTNKKYIDLLERSLENNPNNKESKVNVAKESRVYWNARKLDYNLHPEKYLKAITLYHETQQKFKQEKEQIDTIRKKRMDKAVENFQDFDDRNSFPKKSILFIGSSSIAGWKTALSFPEFPIINRGIGGMNIPEILYYYDNLVKKYTPSIVAIYCDIDIEQGKSPEVAVQAFTELVTKIKKDFPKATVLLLSMKPVMIDDFIGKDIRMNKMLANKQLLNYSEKEKNVAFIDLATPMLKKDGKLRTDIFIEDGMHLNTLGYTIWDPIIRKKLLELNH